MLLTVYTVYTKLTEQERTFARRLYISQKIKGYNIQRIEKPKDKKKIGYRTEQFS